MNLTDTSTIITPLIYSLFLDPPTGDSTSTWKHLLMKRS